MQSACAALASQKLSRGRRESVSGSYEGFRWLSDLTLGSCIHCGGGLEVQRRHAKGLGSLSHLFLPST